MNKQERIKEYQNTIDIVNNGSYDINDTTIYVNDKEQYMMDNTITYGTKIPINKPNDITRYPETKIQVINEDTLYAAQNLIKQGYKTAILNMASTIMPGGGVINGSSAQEESIFRRTNIFKSLYQFHQIGTLYNIKQDDNFKYPIHNTAIYTPQTMVFKQAEIHNCKLMKEPFYADVITIAAIKNPPLNDKDNTLTTWAKNILVNKVKQILNIAINNNNDSLILGAFGCGAYKTPPQEMANIFKTIIIDDKQYQNTFKNITFAILNINSTNFQIHNPEGNFKPFYDTFKTYMN